MLMNKRRTDTDGGKSLYKALAIEYMACGMKIGTTKDWVWYFRCFGLEIHNQEMTYTAIADHESTRSNPPSSRCHLGQQPLN